MKRRYQNPPQLKNGNDGLWFFQEKGGGGCKWSGCMVSYNVQ